MPSKNALKALTAIRQHSTHYAQGWVPIGLIRAVADIRPHGVLSRNEEFCLALAELVDNGTVSLIRDDRPSDVMLINGAYIGGERKDYARINPDRSGY
jgi:hypothetical protein